MSKTAIIKIPMGDATGKKEFAFSGILNIGRDAENDIVIPNLNISRKHARITINSSNDYYLEDLGSHNGTILNGRLARNELLHHGDIISIADSEMTFILTDEAPQADTSKKLSGEDLGMMGCYSTSFIDITQLKKGMMEELRKKNPPQ